MKLETKLVSLVVPLIVIPFLALGGLAYIMLQDNTTKNIAGKMSAIVDQLEHRFTDKVINAKANIQSFTDSPRLKAYLLTTDEMDRYSFQYPHLLRLFNSYHKAYPDYYEIRVILPDGYSDVFSTTKSFDNSYLPKNFPFFQELSTTNKDHTNRILKNPTTNQYALYVGQKILIRAPNIDPVIAPPKLLGYLAATINLSTLQDLSQHTTVGENGGVSVIYKDGTILFDKRAHRIGDKLPNELLKKLTNCRLNANRICHQDTSFTYVTHHHDESYNPKSTTMTDELSSDIFTIAWIPTKELSSESEYLGKFVLFSVIASIIVISLLIIIILRNLIITPINTLRNATLSIGKGNLENSINLNSNDEVGDLGASFDSMRKNLVSAHP